MSTYCSRAESLQRDEGGADTASARMHHHCITPASSNETCYEWCASTPFPFDELIVSWNASRPQEGSYSLFLSVEVERRWSPYYLYSIWGATEQSGGDIGADELGIRIAQDTLQLLNGRRASRFRVRIEACGSARMNGFRSLHACVSLSKEFRAREFISSGSSINLDVPLASQFTLPHARKRDLCSPTSTSAVVSFLQGRGKPDPIAFAKKVHDALHDIYGNWVLNAAHASSLLGEGWNCWVQRLDGFGRVYDSLLNHHPVVVSIKGEIAGAPFPYPNGHLLVVKGYLPESSQVVCMDPALPTDSESEVRYSIADFMEAWSRRRCLAYLFQKRPFAPGQK